MKHYPPPTPRPRARPLRIPDFHAVPGRSRRDGWTPLRQAEFIGFLAQTGSVSAAAREVAMARESAYRLRQRPWAESFCRAWDTALGLPGAAKSQSRATLAGKVTVAELQWRVETGLWRVQLERGRYTGVWRKADNSALLALLALTDRGERSAAAWEAGQ